MHHYFSRNKDRIKEYALTGDTILDDKQFDIKNFLNSIERFNIINKHKGRNILNMTSQYKTFNSIGYPSNYTMHNGYLKTFNTNIPTKNKTLKKTCASFSTGLTRQKQLNTTSCSTYMDYMHNNNMNTNNNFLSTKNSNKLLHNRRNIFRKYKSTHSNDNFNVFKAIKEIKESSLFPNITNPKISQSKQFFITNNNESKKSPLAYKKEYIDIVSDSRRVINDYNFRKGLNLEVPDKLMTFTSKKKEISIKNVLIDLLYNESEKLSVKEKILKSKSQKTRTSIDKNIKDFEDYTEKYRQICKNIQNLYYKIQKENEVLLNELFIYQSIHKGHLDEIQRILEQIDKLREYALFVHQSLGKDTSRYTKIISPDWKNDNLDDYGTKIEKIKNYVINNYSLFWDNNYKKELKDELDFLENPSIMSQKLNEIEEHIMFLIHLKDNLNNEIREDAEKHKKIIKELKSKYDFVEDEYKKNEEILNLEIKQINNLKQKKDDGNSDFNELIRNLFLYIVEVFGEKDKRKANYISFLKDGITSCNVDACLVEGTRILRENEEILNNALYSIKTYKENDEKFFNSVSEQSKRKNKMQKHLSHKKNKIYNQYENEAKIINKANKVNIILRKTEAPYHSPKKKIKTTINYALIKQLEDEELLKYE